MEHNKMNLRRIICSGFVLLFLMTLPGIVPLAKAEDSRAIIAFGQVAGYSGEEICVPVTITGNPGLASFRFQVKYDADALTPVAVERGPLLGEGVLYSNEEGNDTGSLSFLWYHTKDVQGDGELVVIRFRVATTANGNYPLNVYHSPDDVSNAALKTIPHTVQEGSVQVAQRPTCITIKPPDKLWYWEGEELDLTGMTVTAHYADGTDKVITDYAVSGFDTSPGEKEIVITVQDVSASFKVTVREGTAPVPGDLNGDGLVTGADVRIVQRAAAELETLTDEQKLLADVNGDGIISAADVRRIAQMASGM